MVEITEGRLHFQFAPGISAIKFDDSSWHKIAMRTRFKAMDILVAVPLADDVDAPVHWWIEIKDCFSFEDENRPRLNPKVLEEVKEAKAWIKEKGWEKKVKVTRKKAFLIEELFAKVDDTLVSMKIAKIVGDMELESFASTPHHVVLVLGWQGGEFGLVASRLQTRLEGALDQRGLQGMIVEAGKPIPGLACSTTRIPVASSV